MRDARKQKPRNRVSGNVAFSLPIDSNLERDSNQPNAAMCNKWLVIWMNSHGFLSHANTVAAFAAHPEWRQAPDAHRRETPGQNRAIARDRPESTGGVGSEDQ